MPNHVHVLIAFRNTDQSINTIVGNGKRFIAYGIVQRLKQQREEKLIKYLGHVVEAKDRERNKKHEVWEDSFDWKLCRSNEFMIQKLDYMHNNPCSGKWELVQTPENYEHSSAKYYLTGDQGIYEVFSYCKLADVDLTKPKK